MQLIILTAKGGLAVGDIFMFCVSRGKTAWSI